MSIEVGIFAAAESLETCKTSFSASESDIILLSVLLISFLVQEKIKSTKPVKYKLILKGSFFITFNLSLQYYEIIRQNYALNHR